GGRLGSRLGLGFGSRLSLGLALGGGGALGSRRAFTLGGLLLRLALLGHDLNDADLGQAVRAAAVLPPLRLGERLDSFAAGEHTASALERILAPQAFVDGHAWVFLRGRASGPQFDREEPLS